MKGFAFIFCFIAAVSLADFSAAEPFPPVKNMGIGNETTIPVGHFDYCDRNPADCGIIPYPRGPESMSPDRWRAIREMNKAVNALYVSKTDNEIYGLTEYWTFPSLFADCEDFAIAKRRILIEEFGFSPSNALLTVVRRNGGIGEGHAILTIRTSEGDYLLDNLDDEVRLWSETVEPYLFLKRQSSFDASKWVAIEPEIDRTKTASASADRTSK